MFDKFKNFLKDNSNFENLGLHLIVVLLIIAVLKFYFKSSNLNSNYFDYLIKSVVILFCLFIIGNVILNEDYNRLVYLLFASLFFFLVNKFPKFLKWYDNKVDDFIGGK